MQIDIDRILEEDVLGWNLSLTIAKRQYIVRPIVLADVARLQKVLAESDKNIGATQKMVEGFFADPKPDSSQWTMRQLLAAMKAVMVYWQKSAEKNLESASIKVEAQVNRLMSGSSTPPS